MANLYDTANQLERELRESELFADLTAALKDLQEDTEATELISKHQELMQSLQMKQMTGQEPTEEETAEIQSLIEEAEGNATIKQVSEVELKMNQLMEDINKIITAPLQELYQVEEVEVEEAEDQE